MKYAGIDIGSRTIKIVIVENNEIIFSFKKENTFDTINDCQNILKDLVYDHITATGYGRHLFAEYFPQAEVISEIKAFALGVNHLYPESKTILDIGGQDTKAISLGKNGSISKFEMNDKCAAGTGKFLEIMAMTLRSSLNDFASLALQAQNPHKINSMCTVFAESEVISLLSKGYKREDIAYGLVESVVNRSIVQLRRVGIDKELVFVGGVALNKAIAQLLAHKLNVIVKTPEDPQIIGALGAALSIKNKFETTLQ